MFRRFRVPFHFLFSPVVYSPPQLSHLVRSFPCFFELFFFSLLFFTSRPLFPLRALTTSSQTSEPHQHRGNSTSTHEAAATLFASRTHQTLVEETLKSGAQNETRRRGARRDVRDLCRALSHCVAQFRPKGNDDDIILIAKGDDDDITLYNMWQGFSFDCDTFL